MLGFKDVSNILEDNKSITTLFRDLIIKYYKENPQTKYIVNKIATEFACRTSFVDDVQEILNSNNSVSKMAVTVVYGIMTDLGYRN